MEPDQEWRVLVSLPAIIDTDGFAFMEQVWDLHLKNKSEYAIARALGCKVVEARNAIEQWNEIIRDDMESRDAARDHLNAMVKRYEYLMSEAQQNLEDLRDLAYDEKVSAQINATLKNIADFDAKRVDALQKAGLLDAHNLGDELAEREQREAMLLNILRNDLCDDCKEVVRDKLTQLTGVVEGTVLSEQTHYA